MGKTFVAWGPVGCGSILRQVCNAAPLRATHSYCRFFCTRPDPRAWAACGLHAGNSSTRWNTSPSTTSTEKGRRLQQALAARWRFAGDCERLIRSRGGVIARGGTGMQDISPDSLTAKSKYFFCVLRPSHTPKGVSINWLPRHVWWPRHKPS